MNRQSISLLAAAFIILSLLASCRKELSEQQAMVAAPLRDTVLARAGKDLAKAPLTVTAFTCERSSGGIHDFFSEGDYWWPDPSNPDGPYIRRDGESNPDNFVEHRHAMIRFSQIVAELASAYLLTGDEKYVRAAETHLRAWFIDPSTMMNPNLLYAQAIKGITPGRGIGIIDTVHLVEVAQSVIRLHEAGVLDPDCYAGVRQWFSEYLEWITTHKNGLDEMAATNNHGTCWVLQAAAFAKLTGNTGIMELCSDRFKNVFLVKQTAPDGSFPRELGRTKPYCYSLFNLDAMAGICQVLSSPEDDLWDYTTEDGKNMRACLSFMLPFIKDKSLWTYGEDVMYWDEWPVAQPALIFAWAHFHDKDFYDAWLPLDHFPINEEVIRNLPLRNPLIWLY